MLIVAAAADSIQITQAVAPSAGLHCVASYREITDDTGASYKPRPVAMLATTTAAQTIVGGAAAGSVRVIDYLSVYNPNVANATVTLWQEISGVDYTLIRVILGQFEKLEYAEGTGWRVLTSAGSVKTSMNQGSPAGSTGETTVVLAADVINNNATANSIQDVTGLQFPVLAGQRYAFEFRIRYLAAATTTGSRWSINGPSFDELAYSSDYVLTTTSETLNRSLITYDQPTTSNASSGSTAGNLAWIRGIIRPTADGNVIARFASEIANSAITAKAGSFCRYQQL